MKKILKDVAEAVHQVAFKFRKQIHFYQNSSYEYLQLKDIVTDLILLDGYPNGIT